LALFKVFDKRSPIRFDTILKQNNIDSPYLFKENNDPDALLVSIIDSVTKEILVLPNPAKGITNTRIDSIVEYYQIFDKNNVEKYWADGSFIPSKELESSTYEIISPGTCDNKGQVITKGVIKFNI
jgi:hypothetical protein